MRDFYDQPQGSFGDPATWQCTDSKASSEMQMQWILPDHILDATAELCLA
jgi:hypothetical protein